jgi:hypothetical protein
MVVGMFFFYFVLYLKIIVIMGEKRNWLSKTVFPSKESTIFSIETGDVEYGEGGAHKYGFINCFGFNPETKNTVYTANYQTISFVQKLSDGEMSEGAQSEQLLICLIDRHKKLNAKFPSREGSLAITKMEEALFWLEARVKERMDRDVMGELKK